MSLTLTFTLDVPDTDANRLAAFAQLGKVFDVANDGATYEDAKLTAIDYNGLDSTDTYDPILTDEKQTVPGTITFTRVGTPEVGPGAVVDVDYRKPPTFSWQDHEVRVIEDFRITNADDTYVYGFEFAPEDVPEPDPSDFKRLRRDRIQAVIHGGHPVTIQNS